MPAVTLDGAADGVVPATDERGSARHCAGKRIHRRIALAGHNLPQETPGAFAEGPAQSGQMGGACLTKRAWCASWTRQGEA